MSTVLTSRLSALWRSSAEAVLAPTSLGVSGGLWSLPVRQKLQVPPLDHMRLIVNLAPLDTHCFWSDGRQRRSDASAAGAIRIAPAEETASAEVRGKVFRFAQIYISRTALDALGHAPLLPGSTSAFRDLNFDAVDPLVAELVSCLLMAGDEPANALYRDHLSLALLSHLHYRYGVSLPTRNVAGRLDARRLRMAIDYLEQAETTPSIRELGALVGLSPHHFTRSFRLATGMPPHAYLRLIRIERAKRALADGRDTITDIALECGYASTSAFSAAFTRVTGRSPRAWRNAATTRYSRT